MVQISEQKTALDMINIIDRKLLILYYICLMILMEKKKIKY